MKRSSFQRCLGALVMVVAIANQTGWARAGTSGGVAGTVSDAKTGQGIPGVTLQVSSRAQSATATTDARGHFIIFSLQPDDDYTFTASKAGYFSRSVSGYSVYADQTQRYDLQLIPSPAASPTPTPAPSSGSRPAPPHVVKR
ncbi:MAG: carboxypeptidase-like regulatory domain-containing protein [Candidatus Baltobacteraceae bacterium]